VCACCDGTLRAWWACVQALRVLAADELAYVKGLAVSGSNLVGGKWQQGAAGRCGCGTLALERTLEQPEEAESVEGFACDGAHWARAAFPTGPEDTARDCARERGNDWHGYRLKSSEDMQKGLKVHCQEGPRAVYEIHHQRHH
jgi:hypothetical protein